MHHSFTIRSNSIVTHVVLYMVHSYHSQITHQTNISKEVVASRSLERNSLPRHSRVAHDEKRIRIGVDSLSTETVEGATRTLECVDNIKSGDGLALSVLSVGDLKNSQYPEAWTAMYCIMTYRVTNDL